MLTNRRPIGVVAGKFYEFPKGAIVNELFDGGVVGRNLLDEAREELCVKRITIVIDDNPFHKADYN